jgi:hypothetical protein
VQEIVFGHIAGPIVQRRSAHGQPQQDANHIHNGVGKITLVLLIIGAWMRNQLNRSVDQENDYHTGGEDFRVCTFLLVQVPYAADAQEFTTKSGAVENDDDDVDDLRT